MTVPRAWLAGPPLAPLAPLAPLVALAALAALAALSGCADPPRPRPTPRRREEAPERPPERALRTVRVALLDSGMELDDAFDLEVDGVALGQTPVGARREWDLTLLEGEHTVRVRGAGAPDGLGTYTLELHGARAVEGPRLTGLGLNLGVVFTWRIVVE